MNFIDGVGENKSHVFNVLYKFPNPDNKYKVAVDRSERLMKLYREKANDNALLFQWLDWMTKSPSYFEFVNINIDDSIGEEEMYLMIASASKPNQTIIVHSHQYWINYSYAVGCNNIAYNNSAISILDKDDAFQELNRNIVTIHDDKLTYIDSNNTITLSMNKNNPWTSGSFYVVTFIVVLSVISVASIWINPWLIIPCLIASALLLSIIGAFQLRNDGRLSEKKFGELMFYSLRHMSFLRKTKK